VQERATTLYGADEPLASSLSVAGIVVDLSALIRRAVVLRMAGLSVCATAGARAESAGAVSLTWSAPQEGNCPSQAEVQSAIERVVGSAPSRQGPPVSAVAQVEQLGAERYRVKLRTRASNVDGTRVLEERSCRALSEAVVVILGWMVAPDAGAEPAAIATPERASPPAAPKAPPSAWRPAFGLLASVDHGTLPSTSLGVTGRFGLARGWLGFGAYAALFPARDYATARVLSETAGANLSLAAIGIDACLQFAPTPFFACVAGQLEHAWGRGFGVEEPAAGNATWPALAAAAGAAIPLTGPLSLEIRGGPVVPLVRERFGLDGVGEVNTPAAVALRAGAGLSAIF
jgi:hypothetical protein